MSGVKKVYCHCAYAKIISEEVKNVVLGKIAESQEEIICLPDLCEMAARKDPELARIFSEKVRLAACYERAVKWLCHSGGVTIEPENVEIINMRELNAEEVCHKFFRETN